MKKNNDYWNTIYELSVEETNKELTKLYKKTAHEIIKDIKKNYNKFATRPEDIIPNDWYKNNTYYELLRRINQQLNALGVGEYKVMEKALTDWYLYTYNQVGVDYGFALHQATARDVVNTV